ncbi:hypothetical protein [Streptomyces bobili]|uniref:hypothetical protein n=1 Tax=Streptomyces bobili TaxID=67280 RepID=UPI002B1DD71D|nr:hypothetical protein [Streptomyces bobili]
MDASTTWPEPTIDDHAERTTATVEAWKSINGQQPSDPTELAHALLTLAGQDQPPLRFVVGADAIEGATAKAKELLAQAEASRELGGNLGHDHTNASHHPMHRAGRPTRPVRQEGALRTGINGSPRSWAGGSWAVSFGAPWSANGPAGTPLDARG